MSLVSDVMLTITCTNRSRARSVNKSMARTMREDRFAEVLDDLLLVPPVVRLFAPRSLESHGGIRGRAASLELLMADKASRHGETVRVDRSAVNPVLRGARYCIRGATHHLSAIKPNCCAMRINCSALSAPNFCLIDDW